MACCTAAAARPGVTSKCVACGARSEEHTSELQSPCNIVCRLLLEKKKTLSSGSLLFERRDVAALSGRSLPRLRLARRGRALRLSFLRPSLTSASYAPPPAAQVRIYP